MLHHRHRTTHVSHTRSTSLSDVFILRDGSVVVCFREGVRKVDVAALLLETPPDTLTTLLLTGKSISRQALDLVKLNPLEFVASSVYSFDRTQSLLVPSYSLMTPEEVLAFEKRHQCAQIDWPAIHTDDPLMVYLGYSKGSCLWVRDLHGIPNVRYVQTRPSG